MYEERIPLVFTGNDSFHSSLNQGDSVCSLYPLDLVTKGLIHPVKIHDELIAREIIINDADPGVRYKLTKRQTQEEVCFLFWALRRANRFCDLNKLTVQLNCFCCAKN
jgi:hypothetical protein